jgi:uncharacterized protein involved in exopolysaccharide biosynthesis
MDNAFIQQLRGEVLHGEAKLQELATQYGVNHPVYRRQVSENQSMRARLRAEIQKLAAGAASAEVAANPRRAAGGQGNSNDAQLTELVDPILVRNVESAEHAYETAMQRAVVSQVDSRASQTNVTVLNPAVAPLQAYRPNVMLNIALSLFTGVVLGGILVALLEMRDGLVRSSDDLLRMGDVPLLAVLGDDGKRASLLLPSPSPVLRALPKPP